MPLFAVSGVDLFDGGQSEHDLASVVSVDACRVVGVLPDGVTLQIDSGEAAQHRQDVDVRPTR